MKRKTIRRRDKEREACDYLRKKVQGKTVINKSKRRALETLAETFNSRRI